MNWECYKYIKPNPFSYSLVFTPHQNILVWFLSWLCYLPISNSKIKMRRNCNLELRLHNSSAAHHGRRHLMQESGAGTPQQPQQPQQLTIFYNGTMCVSDVTELQARAILFVASRSEMKERVKTPLTLSPSTESGFGSEPCSPSITLQSQSPLCSPVAAGLSMKRSLQRFLQKREHRIQAASPYHFH